MANDVTQDALLIALAAKDLPPHRPAESSADLIHPPNKRLAEAARRYQQAYLANPHPYPTPASDTLIRGRCKSWNPNHSQQPLNPPFRIRKMSFFGMGRPQPTSAEKIASVEQEMKLMADMHNR